MKHSIRQFFLITLLLMSTALFSQAERIDLNTEEPISREKASVLFNEIPYKTDKYNRVTYTLQLWQFHKENLILDKIVVIDEESKEDLLVINNFRKIGQTRDEDNEFPLLVEDELTTNPYFEVPELTQNYITLQIPLKLAEKYPSQLSHIFYFRNSQTKEIYIHRGAKLSPRYNEQPLIIASPIKGKNLLLINQSTMAYHVDAMLMTVEEIGRGERFAFDYIRMNDDFSAYFSGDHEKNESYFCYGDTIYAVADGIVDHIVDGLPENRGDSRDVKFDQLIGAAGNFIAQKLDDGNYAWYAHIIPGSILVKEGDRIMKGQAIGRVGNSGNSDCPHLHFQITKGSDMFLSEGVPFVLDEFMLAGEAGKSPTKAAINVKESMMEQFSVINYKQE